MASVTLYAIVSYFHDEKKAVRRGENSVKSNHVMEVKCDWTTGVIKGKIQASMKDKTYDVMVTLTDEGAVDMARCRCPRGLFKCHHMAALMIFAHKNISSTDGPCQWKIKCKSTDKGKVRTVSEIYPSAKPDYVAIEEPVCPESLEEARRDLMKLGLNTPFEWIHSPEPDITRLSVPTLDDIVISEAFIKAENQQKHVLDAMPVTAVQVDEVSRVTTGQRDSPYWYMYRKGRLTASNFGRVLKAIKRGSFPPSLFKTLMGEYNLDGVKAIQWGIDHEEEAIQEYTEEDFAAGVKVNKCGLYLDSSGMLGASPDGLIGEDGLIEVKCPYTQRDTGIFAAIGKKDFPLQRDREGKITFDRDHAFYHQIQGQLYLTGRLCCSLFLWTRYDNCVVGIRRDNTWAPNLEKLKSFYVNQLLPKLLAGGL